jgi:hypothetical protein
MNLEEFYPVLIDVLCRHVAEGTEENNGTLQVTCPVRESNAATAEYEFRVLCQPTWAKPIKISTWLCWIDRTSVSYSLKLCLMSSVLVCWQPVDLNRDWLTKVLQSQTCSFWTQFLCLPLLFCLCNVVYSGRCFICMLYLSSCIFKDEVYGFLQNFSKYIPHYTVSHPRRQ